MADVFTIKKRRQIMSSIRGKNTRPERIVRRIVSNLGCRYRLHVSDLLGKPDLVFRSRRKVIFVHGCFWQRHHCSRGKSMPNTAKEFWRKKLNANESRDRITNKKLEQMGWQILIVWECQLKKGNIIRSSVARFLSRDCG